jgi:hypothetical protein
MTFAAYREHCVQYIGAQYTWGGHSPHATDCSGILRAFFNLPFTANDFYHRLFTHKSGDIGAYFFIDSFDHAFHVMPYIGDGMVIDAQLTGVVMRPIKVNTNAKLFYI